jgi:hypothetical protein
VADLRLDRVQLAELAELVADALAVRLGPSAPGAAGDLVDPQAVADRYGVKRDFVYRHAAELGAVRLGEGPRAPLRFDLEEVGRRLTVCSPCSESEARAPAVVQGSSRRRRQRSGTAASLLPIRGASR